MASTINSLKVNGVKGRSNRNLSYDHVSTIDFNVVKPMGVFELVPGDRINITPEIWMRTQAMNVPTFGKMDVITRAFFVPLRLAWKDYMNFYRQSPVQNGNIGGFSYFSTVPHCTMHDLSDEFVRRFVVKDSETSFINYDGAFEEVDGIAKRLSFGAMYQAGSTGSTPCEFTIRHNAYVDMYKFNPIGKRVFDLFNSIGYRFQLFRPNMDTSTNKGTTDNYYDVTILPLVGWLKMFQDWYCPAEFKYLFDAYFLDNINTSIDSATIKKLFDELTWAVFIYFNDDIFSMCEQAPYRKGNAVFSPDALNMSQIDDAPNSLLSRTLNWHQNTIVADSKLGGRVNNFDVKYNGSSGRTHLSVNGERLFGSLDPAETSRQSYVEQGSNFLSMAGAMNNQISNWSVMAVLKTAQWLQRNNLLSARATEYLKSKFGVTPSAERLNIAEYIGHAGAPVKISDIAGTSDGNLAELGAKGTSYNIDKISYTAEEFGYLYFTCELRPRIGYGQGVDPLVLRTRLEEFYNEEFDSIGFEPVPTECLVAGPNSYESTRLDETMNIGNIENRIFGYLPRLWSYKCKHDNLSGDFLLPTYYHGSFANDIQAYHLMRAVRGEDLEDFCQNSLSFRYAGLCVKENNFGRIFQNDDYLYDHFQLICSFDANVNGIPLAMNESWQVNADHDERQGHLTNIQSSL